MTLRKALMKLLNWFWIEMSNHNRYKSIAFIFCTVFLLYCNGCGIKCNSILNPGQRISPQELQLESDYFESKLAVEVNEINRQEMLRQYLYNTALTTAATGSFNWIQFLTGAGSLIGAGAFADNVRFRIKTKKSA